MVTTTQQVKGSYLIIASGNEQFPQLGYLTYLDALIKTTFSSATTSAKQKEEHTHIIYICTSVCISNFLLACCRSLAAKKKTKTRNKTSQSREIPTHRADQLVLQHFHFDSSAERSTSRHDLASSRV